MLKSQECRIGIVLNPCKLFSNIYVLSKVTNRASTTSAMAIFKKCVHIYVCLSTLHVKHHADILKCQFLDTLITTINPMNWMPGNGVHKDVINFLRDNH